jgi:ATP-dependent RNA helicase HelY
VIEKLRKYTGDGWQDLTSGEYTQLTGRAGRRGIDDVGYAIVLWSPFTSFATVASLASKRSYVLESSFRPTYNMASNLVQRYAADVAHHLLNLSFAQYRRDRGIVQQERELERKQQLLVIEERAARCECGDVEEYRRRLTRAQRDERDGPRREAGIPTLTPGEVVVLPRGDRAVVVQVIGRGGALVVTPSAKTVRVSARDLGRLARPGTSIELPGRFTPRSDTFKRELAQRLRTVKLPAVAVHKRTRRDPTQAALAEHPAAACPDLRSHLQHAGRAERLRRDVGALQQRIKQRSESLARQFDRVLGLLESWGYVDGWSLTDAGRLLARIYCECDLLVAESLRAGFFDGLTPPAVAALASCFTYETRGPGAERRAVAPVRWPQRGLRDLWGKIERLSRDLALAEHDGSLTETRAPDPGFAVAAYRWATGDDLEDVLDDDNELTGGDFVRNMKQLIDLLRQIGDVAPAPTAAAARDAAGALFRGVVAASAVVGA